MERRILMDSNLATGANVSSKSTSSSITLGNKTGFISDHSTMLICFLLENPLGTNDFLFCKTMNQGPNIISGELMELFMHGRHPAFILKCFINFLGLCFAR
jgi:hypothetical protein